MTTKQIILVPYNPSWPGMFSIEAASIRNALGGNLLDIHHIGSTSVPGLLSKACIDIMAVVSKLDESISSLESIEYICKGELNIPFRYFFNKKNGINVNLHVVESNSSFINLNLSFRDYLRAHPDTATEYANLKKRLLERTNTFELIDGIFAKYTLEKNDFIKGILNKIGFSDISINFCLHEKEWEEYHRIKKEQIFSRLLITYDKNHPTLNLANHFHFVVYSGTKIVGILHLEFLKENEIAIRALAVDAPYQKQGIGTYILEFIERWVKSKGKSVIKLHAAPSAEMFYRKLGYKEIEFDDVSISPETIDLGKTL